MFNIPLVQAMRHLRNAFGRGVEYVTGQASHPHTMTLFRKALYLWVAGYVALLLPAASSFYGPLAYIPAMPPYPSFLGRAFLLLDVPNIAPWWPAFLACLVIALMLGLTDRFPRLAAITVFFLVKNLDVKAWTILNGGNNLMELMLLYNIFINPAPPERELTASRAVNNTLTNCAFFIARFQLVMVYTVAGLAKLQGDLWPHGVALYYVLNTDEYTCPWARHLIGESDWLINLGSYAPVAFMLAFPWLIWNRRSRVGLLLFGTVFHLGIAVCMGLVDFAAAMIACYTVWFADSWAYALKTRLFEMARHLGLLRLQSD